MISIQPYRILVGAGLAVLVGAAGAQPSTGAPYPTTDKNATQSLRTQPPEKAAQTGMNTASPASRLPATKAMTVAKETSSSQSTEKMSGQSSEQDQTAEDAGTHMHGQKPAKPTRHTAKRGTRSDQIAARGESPYRQALRQCVMEQDQGQRDRCLDNAIERFQRST
jgi:hypothetical protein